MNKTLTAFILAAAAATTTACTSTATQTRTNDARSAAVSDDAPELEVGECIALYEGAKDWKKGDPVPSPDKALETINGFNSIATEEHSICYEELSPPNYVRTFIWYNKNIKESLFAGVVNDEFKDRETDKSEEPLVCKKSRKEYKKMKKTFEKGRAPTGLVPCRSHPKNN